jgi:anaerobic ribonucleoside-triphosphate reductase activating protein
MSLRLARVHHPVTALGYGRRLGIWVQGCPLACSGCMSRETWAPTGGFSLEVDELVDLVAERGRAGDDGITISGGEPLAQAAELATLLDRVRARTRREDFDIMLYTGYELTELDAAQTRAAELADVLITGRYEASQPTDLIWRGSANQRMHMLTELGRQRYEPFVDHVPQAPPIQLSTDAHGFWLVGVPRRGTLAAVERRLRALGVKLASASWRR